VRPADLPDPELMDRLKHLAAQWFNNTDILVLEELFRRYERAKTDNQKLRSPVEEPTRTS
jgi:hypothetical protein